MTVRTVMFGDDPLAETSDRDGKRMQVKVFNTPATAYWFKKFCIEQGLYADVVLHPYAPEHPTLH